MKKFFTLLPVVLILAAVITSCGLLNIAGSSELPVFMTWDTEGNIGTDKSDEEISVYLSKMKSHNISGIFLAGSNEFYKRITPLANKTVYANSCMAMDHESAETGVDGKAS